MKAIILLGMTGNLLILVTVARSPAMRTTSNIYICNMAVSGELHLQYPYKRKQSVKRQKITVAIWLIILNLRHGDLLDSSSSDSPLSLHWILALWLAPLQTASSLPGFQHPDSFFQKRGSTYI